MRALILANGDPPSIEFARAAAAEHGLLLATDGAAYRAIDLGITPDIVCGDFDSVSLNVVREAFPHALIVPTPEQEHGDLEKAVGIAREHGAAEITIMGATGGRIDQTLAAFFVLVAHHTDISLRVVDDRSEVWAISGTRNSPGRRTLEARPGDTLSIFSLDGKARVTLTGVRWPVHDEVLSIGTRGLSNIVDADEVRLDVRGGTLIVCRLSLKAESEISPPT